MKRFILISILITIAEILSASWMGQTWLWVKVEKVFPYKRTNTRKVQLYVQQWALGSGHGNQYGKSFPGKKFTINLICKNHSVAYNIKPGQTFWVKHHAATWFYRGKGKIAKFGSSRSWKHLGHSIWVYHPIIVKNLIFGDPIPKSTKMQYLWAIRHSNNVTLKLRYQTNGKHYANFKIINIKESRKKVTLAVICVPTSSRTSYFSAGRTKYDQTLQFYTGAFEGKTIEFSFNGRIVARLNQPNSNIK